MNLLTKLKLTVIILVLGMTTQLKAQQDPMYTHYMYNTLAINPAYAGSRDALSFLGLARFQWVGINGAPMTQTFQVHSPITGGLSGGISVMNDRIGPTNSTNLFVDLAYHFKLSQKLRLGIGMKGTVDFYNNNLAGLETGQAGDPLFSNNFSRTLPNIGAGLYLHHENFYVGFSVPKIAQHRLSDQLGVGAEQIRHYFLIAGGYFRVSRTIDFKPTGLLKIAQGAPVEFDATLEAIFSKKFTLGVFGRTFDGIGVLLGYDIMPNFRIGYSFDWPLTQLSTVNQGGSHEIMLRYDLKWGRLGKIKSPRYF